jgi:dipeptide/tripeptide permease
MKFWINKKLVPRMPAIGCLLVGISFLMSELNIGSTACSFLSGFGCAWVGMGVVGIFIKRRRPEYAKKREISQKDERNTQIREKPGYLSFAVTLLVFAILEFVFLLLNDEIACILAIGAMAIHIASFLIAQSYYDKKL